MAELATLARPYARAAWQEASAKGSVDAWLSQLGWLSAVADVEEMAGLMETTAVDSGKLADLVLGTFNLRPNEGVSNLVKLLASNHRLALLPTIFELFVKMKGESEAVTPAKVTSAFELDERQKQEIAETLKRRLGHPVTVDVEVDPSLIGGVLIRAGQLTIDGSVRGKLSKLGQGL